VTPCVAGCDSNPSAKDALNPQETAYLTMAKLYEVFLVEYAYLLPVQGDIVAYDGKSDDLINTSRDAFFTYEFLAVFI